MLIDMFIARWLYIGGVTDNWTTLKFMTVSVILTGEWLSKERHFGYMDKKN